MVSQVFTSIYGPWGPLVINNQYLGRFSFGRPQEGLGVFISAYNGHNVLSIK